MQKLNITKKFTVQKETEWWREAGKEMTAYFGRNCFWIFWKHSRLKIERAWHIAQKEGDRDFRHFMNNLQTK